MPHLHEKIDFTTEVFVVHNGRVLLRKHDKLGIWLSVGGHIELDEDPTEAAVREVKEEVGLDVRLVGTVPDLGKGTEGYRELLAPRFMNRHRVNEHHEHVTLIYFATADTDAVQQGHREVSDAIRWFTADELSDPQYGIRPVIRAYARTALATVATEEKRISTGS